MIEIFQYISCIGYTSLALFSYQSATSFQYISCIGYTIGYLNWIIPVEQNFNTSHVSVILLYSDIIHLSNILFQYISCIGYTPLMVALFLDSHQFQYISCIGYTPESETIKAWGGEFQYISCIGYTLSTTFIFFSNSYFNTSHVSVILYEYDKGYLKG